MVDCHITIGYHMGMKHLPYRGKRLPYKHALSCLNMWQVAKRDTLSIAKLLDVDESAVYNTLYGIKEDVRQYGFMRVGRTKLA